MDESSQIIKDLVQVARLATERKDQDLRLLLARLVRRYRTKNPEVADALRSVLEADSTPVARRTPAIERHDLPEGPESNALSVLRDAGVPLPMEPPVLEPELQSRIELLLAEWLRASELRDSGLEPVASAIFTGPPGVGKSYTARWIASVLKLPLYSLDLTTVMSSRLGQSGANLRAALDFARSQPTVLFLDEIDSIAKKRADESDIGELKRLVTIILQELDDWPSTSLLLAATNHPELVDPAIWRRFDLEVTFPMPGPEETDAAVRRYLGPDSDVFEAFMPMLARFFADSSFSEVQRSLSSLRKARALGIGTPEELVQRLAQGRLQVLGRSERARLAAQLAESGMSQRQVSELTGVSRDTIRKYTTAGRG